MSMNKYKTISLEVKLTLAEFTCYDRMNSREAK